MQTQAHPSKTANLTFGALGLLSSALLSACLQSPASDATDATDYSRSKVTEKVAGQTLAESFSTTQDWDKTVSNPADRDAWQKVFGASTALKKKASLAKLARTSNEDWQVTIDSAAGLVHLSHKTEIAGITVQEEADAKWDDAAKDTIKDNEHLLRFSQTKTYPLGKVEKASFEDGDGDGLINPATKGSKVKITFLNTEGKTVETAVIIAGCGPDLNFDTEADNAIYQADWNRKIDGVLRAEASFLDADQDGIIVDNADTSLVEMRFSDYEPLDRPLVKERHTHAKVRVFGKDENGNDQGDEPVSFGYTETLKSGRVTTVSLRNPNGGEDLVAGDTMTVSVETVAKRDDDTLKTLSLEIVMNPGQDLKSEDDDSVYAFHVKSSKHLGFEREAEFHFYADTPVLHGQEPTAGHFSGKATYANGQTATLEGSFSPRGFSAEYTGPQGSTLDVDFDLAGALQP